MAVLTQGTTRDTIWASHAEGDAVFQYARVIRSSGRICFLADEKKIEDGNRTAVLC
jgi:hypothetical protein